MSLAIPPELADYYRKYLHPIDATMQPFLCEGCGKNEDLHLNPEYSALLWSAKLCRGCHFWDEKYLARNEPRTVRVKGIHYRIGFEGPEALMRGFGGNAYAIHFFDGRIVRTSNLWTQGEVPAWMRDILPDNAVFAQPG